MAHISFSGLEDFETRLARHEKAATDAVPDMLAAGGQAMVEAEKAAIRKYDLIDKGALMKSIKATKPRTKSTETSLEVYPQGKNRKGQRNATVGFVQEYGTSSMDAKPWHSEAVEKGREPVREEMNRVWQEKTGS